MHRKFTILFLSVLFPFLLSVRDLDMREVARHVFLVICFCTGVVLVLCCCSSYLHSGFDTLPLNPELPRVRNGFANEGCDKKKLISAKSCNPRSGNKTWHGLGWGRMISPRPPFITRLMETDKHLLTPYRWRSLVVENE
jgi:hypothetical protein